MNLKSFLYVLSFSMVCSSAQAVFEPLIEGGEWTAETGIEYRYFKDPGENGQAQSGVALRLTGEYYNSWNEGDDFVVFTPYLLLDQQDSERTHADIRELLWVHVGNDWELRTGITRVFWGKTEFLNVVDVVNQTDLVDGDGEKLGQPMVNFSVVHDWGIFDFYLLLGFRERTFPGEDGRLRTYFEVDTDNVVYSSDTGPNDVDFAFRWQRPLNDYVEMAFSIFSGVDREPWYSVDVNIYDLEKSRLIPNYHHKDQFGLELEYIYEGWAVKFEGVVATDPEETYHQLVTGVEYSFYDMFGSGIDMTFITEGMYDSRDDSAPGFLEHDVGFGGRFTFNDEYDTTLLAGMLWDPDTDERALGFEAERRLNSNFKIEVQAVSILERGSTNVPENSFEAITTLINDGSLDLDSIDFDIQTIIDILPELLIVDGNTITLNRFYGFDGLTQFVRFIDDGRKLSLVESEDYIMFRLTYFY